MSTASNSPHDIGERKAQHLEICVRKDEYAVETGSSYFDRIRFVHRALPEISETDIDASLDFLGYRVKLPIFISSMTGGSAEGFQANKNLARAAQKAGVPVGMGSIRIIFRKPEVEHHFRLKELAPDVPVFANIGGVQVREMEQPKLLEAVRRLGVDALVVHLNPGQELFQPGGDRDFSGILEAIARLCDASPVPIIAKETGFGIAPEDTKLLLEAGVSFVNLAGSGGTNWVSVEAHRLEGPLARAAAEFGEWGIPTAAALLAVRGRSEHILASGGIRSGLDVAKASALGARLSGLALPFIRAVVEKGVEGVLAEMELLELVLRRAMTLVGARNLAGLRKARLIIDPGLKELSEQLAVN